MKIERGVGVGGGGKGEGAEGGLKMRWGRLDLRVGEARGMGEGGRRGEESGDEGGEERELEEWEKEESLKKEGVRGLWRGVGNCKRGEGRNGEVGEEVFGDGVVEGGEGGGDCGSHIRILQYPQQVRKWRQHWQWHQLSC